MKQNKLISPPNIYLTSYMRPQLTQYAIEKILKWSVFGELIVVVDGLRSIANHEEKSWRNEVIQIVESYCETNPRMKLWLYEENLGITEHTIRIQGRALESGNSGIWIEEDMDLDFEKFFIALSSINLEDSVDPILLSGYSHFNHQPNTNMTIKGNLFLPMWGLAFNEVFYDLFCRIWHKKSYDFRIVENVLGKIFQDKSIAGSIHRTSAISYWKEYMGWGFRNKNRWDAVANYALWTESCFSLSTVNRLSTDLSHLDNRGMNQRSFPGNVPVHKFEKKELGEYTFCLSCEIEGSRVPRNLVGRAVGSLKYRARKQANW